MKNKFLSISIGITLVLFGTGFLIRSVNTANAAPAPEAFIEGSSNQIGKYMFCLSTGSSNSAIVWDTETGTSAYYDYVGSAYGKSPKWVKGEAQLPADPMAK